VRLGLSSPPRADIGPTLSALSLSASTVAEGAAADTVVGTLIGKTKGSTIALEDGDGGTFDIDGLDIIVAGTINYENATSHDIEVSETLAGATNSPRGVILTITVTNVLEVTLGALTLDDLTCAVTDTPGTKVGTITGGSAGSTITLLTQSVTNAFAKDGADIEIGSAGPLSAGDRTITLRETHTDASNSPRDSVVTITAEEGEVLGNNIVVGGGTFDNGTGWGLFQGQDEGPAPVIAAGVLSYASSPGDDPAARCTATETVTDATTYRVSGTCTAYTSGDLQAVIGGTGIGFAGITGTGPFSVDVETTTATNQFLRFQGEDTAVLSIDNLIVQTVT
jgi:hypothetical protein